MYPEDTFLIVTRGMSPESKTRNDMKIYEISFAETVIHTTTQPDRFCASRAAEICVQKCKAAARGGRWQDQDATGAILTIKPIGQGQSRDYGI